MKIPKEFVQMIREMFTGYLTSLAADVTNTRLTGTMPPASGGATSGKILEQLGRAVGSGVEANRWSKKDEKAAISEALTLLSRADASALSDRLARLGESGSQAFRDNLIVIEGAVDRAKVLKFFADVPDDVFDTVVQATGMAAKGDLTKALELVRQHFPSIWQKVVAADERAATNVNKVFDVIDSWVQRRIQANNDRNAGNNP